MIRTGIVMGLVYFILSMIFTGFILWLKHFIFRTPIFVEEQIWGAVYLNYLTWIAGVAIQILFLYEYVIPFYMQDEYRFPTLAELYELAQAYINDELKPIKDEDEEGEDDDEDENENEEGEDGEPTRKKKSKKDKKKKEKKDPVTAKKERKARKKKQEEEAKK